MAKITIVTLGESGVGKTSLLNRFKTGKFKESIRSTFVDHFSKTIKVENIKTNVVIWDTAGQERYNSLIKRYYAMADGVVLMYDVNDSVTFSKLSRWLSELKSENETAEIIIAGNKNEDTTKKLVPDLDVQNFVENENLQHIEASAKTGQNVDLIFQLLIKKILVSRGVLTEKPPQQSSENKSDTANVSLSSAIKNEKSVSAEPEISFSYYGKSEQSNQPIFPQEEPNTEDLKKEEKTRSGCFSCV